MPFVRQYLGVSPTFRDPLSAVLWTARRDSQRIQDGWNGLSAEHAAEVAQELYAAMEQAGERRVGWKVAATDPRTQAMLGASAPFYAPILSGALVDAPARLSLSDFIAPRVEAEIGLLVTGDELKPVPCIEIIDSRVARTALNLAAAIADFGLQGCLLFGPPPGDAVTGGVVATVSLDEREVACGHGDIATAAAALSAAAAKLGPTALGPGTRVATGSLIDPLPLAVGRWSIDFGALGNLSMEVAP